MAVEPGPAGQADVARYRLDAEIAAGGMAVIHLGRLLGSGGFAKTVAIKRMHPQYAKDPSFVSMFLTEARLAARIRHPNVVSILDVVSQPEGLLLVMEYIEGVSLAGLAGDPLDPALAVAVIEGTLHGLHAAHEAKAEDGSPLDIVHRDVSPQNIVVGVDGIARVLDFGIAKAASVSHATRKGQAKGKVPYMAPEQIMGVPLDRRTDVYAAGVVLWEALTGRRLFRRETPAAVCHAVLNDEVVPPSSVRDGIPHALDAVVMRAIARRPEDRFPTARDAALALESAFTPAKAHVVGAWVQRAGHDTLAARAQLVANLEAGGGGAAFAPSSEAPTDLPSPVRSPAGDQPTFTVDTGGAGRASRRTRIAMVALAALASSIAGAAVFAKVRGASSEPADREMQSTEAPAAAPVDTTSGAASAPAPESEATASAEPGANAAAPPKARPRPKPAASAPKPDCSPPYVRDAQGVKIYKRECL